MNKFFTKGIELQHNSWTIEYANSALERSCTMCALRGGMGITCARCPIAVAHEETLLRLRTERELSYKRSHPDWPRATIICNGRELCRMTSMRVARHYVEWLNDNGYLAKVKVNDTLDFLFES